jgi:hypothetical protein
MRTVYAAIRTYREERDAWELAYYDLSDKSKTFADDMTVRFDSLKTQLDEERAAWKSEIRKTRAPGFGLFGGVSHSGEAVLGVGVVWRLF